MLQTCESAGLVRVEIAFIVLQTCESNGLINVSDLYEILRGQFHVIGMTPQYLKVELVFTRFSKRQLFFSKNN